VSRRPFFFSANLRNLRTQSRKRHDADVLCCLTATRLVKFPRIVRDYVGMIIAEDKRSSKILETVLRKLDKTNYTSISC
jgi:hypothetical protein